MGDVVLAKVTGEKPVDFNSLYDRAVKAREDAERQLDIQREMNEELGSKNKELKSENNKLLDSLETTRRDLVRAEKDAKEVAEASRTEREARGCQSATERKARRARALPGKQRR